MTARIQMFNPSSSDVEIFMEDLKVNMKHIFDNVDSLPEHNQDFALSLCVWYDEYDSLSSKQAYHACRFWQYINSEVGEAGGKVTSEAKDETPPRVIINGGGLIALFDKAFETLKYPSINYYIDINWHKIPSTAIKFYRTGPHNRKYGAGCVAVIFEFLDRNHEKQKEMLAMIVRDGRTAFGKFCFDKPELQQELKRIIESPVEKFKMNGLKYSHCCFCGRELTNQHSLAAGYGPDCAANYNLPWGTEEQQLEDL